MNVSTLPGFSTTKTFDGKYNKPQRFVFKFGQPMEEILEHKALRVPEADHLLGRRNPFQQCTPPILTFKAYYREPVGELNKSTYRYRKCNVLYFVDDDEIRIYEPRQKNSGVYQGTIVQKGRFFKPCGGYYTINDLNIGETLFINGVDFKLIDCDPFTRKYLTEMGFRVRTPEADVVDPITQDREQQNTGFSYKQPYDAEYKYKKFFKYHPKALCFYGYYGDGKKLFEEKREVNLYYDLSYDTIKLVEQRCKKNWVEGKTDYKCILKPMKVPKVPEPSLRIGETGFPTLLTHIHDEQNILIGGRYFKFQNEKAVVVDSNPLGGRKRYCPVYTDRDLELGVIFKIFGSDVFLYDCDEFTKNYYREMYDKEMVPVPRPEVKPFHTHKLIYQHEQIGQPDDSVRTEDTNVPYMCDLRKYMKSDDGCYYDRRELKFLARIISEDSVEKRRVFLVRYFIEDETMDIRALDLDFRNTGIMEHKHIKRMKIPKPRATVGNFERCYYLPIDMYIGNVLHIRRRPYYLTEADEYTYEYMERNCHLFHHSNIKRIMTMMRQWIKDNCGVLECKFHEKDPEKTGCVTYEEFKEILHSLMEKEMKDQYPEQAMRTVGRHYAEDKYIGLRIDDVASRIRTELYRMKWYDFEDLKLAMEIQDEEKTGYLTPKRVYFIMRASSVPLTKDLLKSFVYKFPTTDGKIKYYDVIKAIDFLKNNTKYETEDPYAIHINWEHKEHAKDLEKIRYNCFLANAVF